MSTETYTYPPKRTRRRQSSKAVSAAHENIVTGTENPTALVEDEAMSLAEMNEPLWGYPELSAYLGISEGGLRNMYSAGKLPPSVPNLNRRRWAPGQVRRFYGIQK